MHSWYVTVQSLYGHLRVTSHVTILVFSAIVAKESSTTEDAQQLLVHSPATQYHNIACSFSEHRDILCSTE